MANKNKHKYILALGHLCSDINQGMLSALLPFLIAAYHYNYATAATLVMVSNIVASVIQPVFGHLADKKNKPFVMTLGVLLAGGGMAVTGLISSFPGLCVAVMISGIGVAMFHPQAAKLVNRNSDEKNRGLSLGVFSLGGNLGFTLGPIVATGAITLFGLKGTLVFLIPSMVFSVIAALTFKETDRIQPETAAKSAVATGKDRWGAFAALSALVVFRSIIFSGINTFLALYFVAVMGQSENLGNTFLSLYYAMSAISALIGGKLADSFGNKQTLRLSFALLLPGLLFFTLTKSLALSVILLLPVSMGVSLCFSPMILLGQQYLPNHVGLSSGVTLGLAVSIGGIVAPVLGKIGDLYGLTTTFYVITAAALVSLLISLRLSNVSAEQGVAH